MQFQGYPFAWLNPLCHLNIAIPKHSRIDPTQWEPLPEVRIGSLDLRGPVAFYSFLVLITVVARRWG